MKIIASTSTSGEEFDVSKKKRWSYFSLESHLKK
jgi:hypothetical protein